MSLHNPLILLLLIIPLLYLLFKWKRRKAGIPLSNKGQWQELPRTWKSRLFFLPDVLLALSFSLVLIAMARPQKSITLNPQVKEGIAIEMVIDRSSSMSLIVNREGQNRLDVVKDVFLQFLQSRPNDLIGLIVFAGYADTYAPLTLSHQVLAQFLSGINLVDRESEDGTAMGDAIALAAARLKKLDEDNDNTYNVQSKVIILLTDGESNKGIRSPGEAAELAKEWGIRIYTIGFKSNNPLRMLQGFAGEGTLKEIAQISGGAFFEATNARELEEAIIQINDLETSRLEDYHSMEYEEHYLSFLWAGLFFFLLFLLADQFFFRRLDQ